MYGWLKVAFGICCLGKTCDGIFCLVAYAPFTTSFSQSRSVNEALKLAIFDSYLYFVFHAGWFRFDEEDEKPEPPKHPPTREVEPATLLQSAVREDVKREIRQSCLRRNSTLRRRKVSLPPEIQEQRQLQNMLHSENDLEDVAAMHRKDYKDRDTAVTPVVDETDTGLAGTKKILCRGVSYTELMKPVPPKNQLDSFSRGSPFTNRQGAYGYFRDKTSEKQSTKRSAFREMRETVEHNERQDGQAYYYHEETGTYEYPFGKKVERLETEENSGSSGGIRKKGNEYYDEMGKFLFKTPPENIK